MVDWGTGKYEQTAAELEPVAWVVVEAAAPQRGEQVIDVACGTGNAALMAAARGADVLGVDLAARLLDVAAERAKAVGQPARFVVGDAQELPVADASADLVLSVFGVIFAPDPARAVAEIARVLRPGGRALLTAWIPAGPIDAMLTIFGRAVAQATGAPARERFAWSDPAVVAALAAPHGLSLTSTPAELEIRAASPEAYVDAGTEHPMAVAAWPALRAAGRAAEVRAAMIDVVREANEAPEALLLRTPYVVHTLRAASQ